MWIWTCYLAIIRFHLLFLMTWVVKELSGKDEISPKVKGNRFRKRQCGTWGVFFLLPISCHVLGSSLPTLSAFEPGHWPGLHKCNRRKRGSCHSYTLHSALASQRPNPASYLVRRLNSGVLSFGFESWLSVWEQYWGKFLNLCKTPFLHLSPRSKYSKHTL